MNLTRVLLLVLASFLIGFFIPRTLDTNTQTKSGWSPVMKTGKDGDVILGSKGDLINSLRKGYDLRLGWGWKKNDKSIEHLADPIWIAILNEQEVMVHLDPQVLSSIDWETSSPNYADSTLLDFEWRVAISTDGSFDAVWYNRETNEVHRRIPQNHTMTWMIRFPGENDQHKSGPLFTE